MNTENKNRAFKLLAKLIELYIEEGKPIPSKMLAERFELPLSSASIRNIMSELENEGYLLAPHTSAGRIPTAKGYRFFVDLLANQIENQDLTLNLNFDNNHEPKSLLHRASHLLTELTHLTGLITLPKNQTFILRQIDFLSLDNHRVLVVLVINDFEVQNRVIITEQNYSETQLKEAANFLLMEYRGKDLNFMREDLIKRMQQYKREMESMMYSVMQILTETCQLPQKDYIVAGESHLISAADEIGLKHLQALFAAFNEKRMMLDLMERCADAQGTKIFIGEEAGIEALDAYSMVAAPYQKNQQFIGVVGVIGPVRMPYQSVIRAVNVTAKLLSRALNRTPTSPPL